ncbi:HET-domain-containing protein [Rhizodiscina lignyota]|uniref:HET-domain-containing protein n=1 Tax=Rhizodiscina lignyota TaxID=1504668 RepID=A0A9P4M410_9PEZI|nr:HET-domain-containing protein [Rhizodiscina lignyota]
MGHTASIAPSAGSENGMTFIKEVVSECLKHHEECRKQSDTVPTRLLYIGSNLLPMKIILPNRSDKMLYAALSHCWGGLKSLRLTVDNEESLRTHIEWESLPRTYQDAVIVCRELGLEYLWIDSLCIIQEGDNKLDWAAESSRMTDIYANAYVVIGASSASNPEESILASRTNWRCKTHVIAWGGGELAERLLCARIEPALGHHDNVDDSQRDPLDLRAWAFQEFQLARRCINFTSDEIQWFCRGGQKCECSSKWEPSFTRFEIFGDAKTEDWTDIVWNYSFRMLSLPQDKLAALSGLAARFQQNHKDVEYVAGLWRNVDLPFQLGWRVQEAPGSVYTESRAPSFSWASVDGRAQIMTTILTFSEGRYVLDFKQFNTGTTDIPGVIVEFYADTSIALGKGVLPSGEMTPTAQRAITRTVPEEFAVPVSCLRLHTYKAYKYEVCIVLGRSAHHAGAYERLGYVEMFQTAIIDRRRSAKLPWEGVWNTVSVPYREITLV